VTADVDADADAVASSSGDAPALTDDQVATIRRLLGYDRRRPPVEERGDAQPA
jgi:hypothetical protein